MIKISFNFQIDVPAAEKVIKGNIPLKMYNWFWQGDFLC